MRPFNGLKIPKDMDPNVRTALMEVDRQLREVTTEVSLKQQSDLVENINPELDHGTLAGLGDQADHTWALLVDSSRAGTGTQEFSSASPLDLSGLNPTIEMGTGTIRTITFETTGANFNSTFKFSRNATDTLQWQISIASTTMTSNQAFVFNVSAGNATFNSAAGNVIFNNANGTTVFTHKARFDSAVSFDYEAFTSADTLDDTNFYAACDASGGAFTITLPAAATAGAGRVYIIKKTDSSANAVTVDGNGSETIDGVITQELAAQYDSMTVISDGSNWDIV